MSIKDDVIALEEKVMASYPEEQKDFIYAILDSAQRASILQDGYIVFGVNPTSNGDGSTTMIQIFTSHEDAKDYIKSLDILAPFASYTILPHPIIHDFSTWADIRANDIFDEGEGKEV